MNLEYAVNYLRRCHPVMSSRHIGLKLVVHPSRRLDLIGPLFGIELCGGVIVEFILPHKFITLWNHHVRRRVRFVWLWFRFSLLRDFQNDIVGGSPECHLTFTRGISLVRRYAHIDCSLPGKSAGRLDSEPVLAV